MLDIDTEKFFEINFDDINSIILGENVNNNLDISIIKKNLEELGLNTNEVNENLFQELNSLFEEEDDLDIDNLTNIIKIDDKITIEQFLKDIKLFLKQKKLYKISKQDINSFIVSIDDNGNEIINKVSLKQLNLKLLILVLNKKFPGNEKKVELIFNHLSKGINKKWKLEKIMELIEEGTLISLEEKEINQVLQSITFNLIEDSDENITQIKSILNLNKNEPNNLICQINKFCVSTLFPPNQLELTIDELLNELKEKNKEKITDNQIKNLKKELKQIEKKLKEIKDWKEEDIKKWLSKEKKNKIEILSILSKGNEIIYNQKPRNIQLISLLLMLNKSPNKGLLSQINTGEGKTTIISILASYKALLGLKVDIICSSITLAEASLKEKQKYYELFNLKSSTTKQNDYEKPNKVRLCYESDIVYGDPSSFEGDILQWEFREKGGRGNRNFDCVIIDEVDSICIDEMFNSTRLVTEFNGYEYLNPVFYLIYFNLMILEQKIIEFKNVNGFYEVGYVKDEFNLISFQNNIFTFQNVDTKVTYNIDIEVNANDLDNYIFRIEDNNNNMKRNLIVDGLKKISRETFENIFNFSQTKNEIIENCIKEKVNENILQIKLPKFLKNFVMNNLDDFCESAYYAKNECFEGINYVISELDGKKKVCPVDYRNTGVVMKRVSWDKGLSQFISIKHCLYVENENLVSNYLSNIIFLNKYMQNKNKEINFFGLTGTLGGENSNKILSEVYNSELVIIPPFKKKRFIEYPSKIIKNKDEWYELIIENIYEQAIIKRRAVLVVCPVIIVAKNIKSSLDKLINSTKVKLYTRNDIEMENSSIENSLSPGDVIVATILGGRGTDYKLTNEVEENGGLHICYIGFDVPGSDRVEAQIFGRSARSGLRGSAQMFICSQKSLLELKEIRDKNEKEMVNLLIGTEIERIKLENSIFYQFIDFYKSEKKKPTFNVDINKKENLDMYLKDIEEKWSLWKFEQRFEDEKTDLKYLNDNFNILFIEKFKKRELTQTINPINKLKLREISQSEGNYAFTFGAIYENIINNFKEENNYDKKTLEKYNEELQDILTLNESELKTQLMGIRCLAEYIAKLNNINFNLQEQSIQFEEKMKMLDIFSEYLKKNMEIIKQSGNISIKESTSIEIIARNKNIKICSVAILKSSGLDKLYNLSIETGFFHFLKKLFVLTIGLCETLGGLFLYFNTNGIFNSIGMTLMTTGIKDIFTAIESFTENKCIDLQNFFIKKSWEIGILAITLGFKYVGGYLIDKLPLIKEKIGIKAGMLGDLIQNGAVNLSKNFILKKLIKEVGKYKIDDIIDKLVKKIKDKIKTSLEHLIKKQLREPLKTYIILKKRGEIGMEKRELILKVKEQINGKMDTLKSKFQSFMNKTKNTFQEKSIKKKASEVDMTNVITIFDSFLNIDDTFGVFTKEIGNSLTSITNEIRNAFNAGKKDVKKLSDEATSKLNTIIDRQKNIVKFVSDVFKNNDFTLQNLKNFINKLEEEKNNLNKEGKNLLNEGKKLLEDNLERINEKGDKIAQITNDMIKKSFDPKKIEAFLYKFEKNIKTFFKQFLLDEQTMNELRGMVDQINKVEENINLDNELNEIINIFWEKFEEFINPAIENFKNFIRNVIKQFLDDVSNPLENILPSGNNKNEVTDSHQNKEKK